VSFAHTLKIETAAPVAMRRSESQARKSSGQFRRRSIYITLTYRHTEGLVEPRSTEPLFPTSLPDV